MAALRSVRSDARASRTSASENTGNTEKGSGHRINANFTGEAYDILTDLAESQGKTKSDVLRDAVMLEKWVRDTQREGGRILIEQNGKRRELLLR